MAINDVMTVLDNFKNQIVLYVVLLLTTVKVYIGSHVPGEVRCDYELFQRRREQLYTTTQQHFETRFYRVDTVWLVDILLSCQHTLQKMTPKYLN